MGSAHTSTSICGGPQQDKRLYLQNLGPAQGARTARAERRVKVGGGERD